MSAPTDQTVGIRQKNRGAILAALHEKKDLSRKHLATDLHLTPAAITNITAELIRDGLIEEGTPLVGERAGRREVLLHIRPEAGIALGVHINIRAALLSATDLDGNVIFAERILLERKAPAEETVVRLSKRLLQLLEEHEVPRNEIIGLGIAIRGRISTDRRSVENSYSALDAKNYPIADRFEKLTGFHVTLSNNVRALFEAESFFRRNVEQSEVFLRAEYGIGAAISVNRRVWHGVTEQCSEIGHIQVVPEGGKLCNCGKHGCLETIASPMALHEDAIALSDKKKTPVLSRLLKEKGEDGLTVEDVFEAAEAGDVPVQELVENAVKHLAYALKSTIQILDPGRITLYGRMFDNSYYLDRLLGIMAEEADSSRSVVIQRSDFNRRLEPVAACVLAIASFLKDGGIR